MAQGSNPPTARQRLFGVVTLAVAGACAVAAVVVGEGHSGRSAAAGAPTAVGPAAEAPATETAATDAAAVQGASAAMDTALAPAASGEALDDDAARDEMTDGIGMDPWSTGPATPEPQGPPCPQYYPACGTFSRPGLRADMECGCRADERCSRAKATGRCVQRRPRWMGP